MRALAHQWHCCYYDFLDSFRAQICEALRASCVTIPIVAMTGNVDPTSIRVFKRSGFDGLLAKPFTQASAAAAGCARLLS
jgi:CheY-like chemotaxis protein